MGDVRRPRALRPDERRAGGARRAGQRDQSGARRRRQAAALPQRAAQRRARRDRHDPRGGPGRRLARGDGEAVRHRSRQRRGAQRPPAPDLSRDPDLPHRPLPRQGGRTEHPRLPLRQRTVRADLEPQLHRPRADRHPRDSRPRAAIGVLRVDRCLQGHGGHPPAAGARLRGDGAADRAGATSDQRGEEQGLPLHALDRAEQRRARPVHRLSRRARSGPRLRHRDLHRAALRDRQLALGRRAVLPAHRQAARRRGAHHLDRVQRGTPHDVPGQLRRRVRRSGPPHLRPGRRLEGVAVVLRQATRTGDDAGEAEHAVLHPGHQPGR